MWPPIAAALAVTGYRAGNSTSSTACSGSPRSCRASQNAPSTAPPRAPTRPSRGASRDRSLSRPGPWRNRLECEEQMIGAQEKIGVVGAGLMGAEIRLIFALPGLWELLTDPTTDNLAPPNNRLAPFPDPGFPRG